MKWTPPPGPSRPSVLERAFQLAKSGRCLSMADIRRVLRAEGYADYQLEGRAIVDQLVAMMRANPPRDP